MRRWIGRGTSETHFAYPLKFAWFVTGTTLAPAGILGIPAGAQVSRRSGRARLRTEPDAHPLHPA